MKSKSVLKLTSAKCDGEISKEQSKFIEILFKETNENNFIVKIGNLK
jgi:hypothetical protein